jgi:hypothetical protein
MYGSLEDILYLIDPVIFVIQMVLLVGLLLIAIFYPQLRRRFAPRDGVTASVVGLFPHVDDAVIGVRRLREAGFSGGDVSVLSSIPYPEGAFGTDTGRSWIRPLALAGGIIGALIGIFVVVGTSIAYPLPTGGKPIVAVLPMLVVVYESTVLSVVLVSVARFLYEAKLPSARTRLYDPRIGEGMIGVVARCETDDQARRAEETLSSLGAIEPRRVQGRID